MPHERFRTFSEDFRTFSEDYRRLPKIAEDDRRRSEDVSIIHQQIANKAVKKKKKKKFKFSLRVKTSFFRN